MSTLGSIVKSLRGPQGRAKGSLDGVSEGSARGWAFDAAEPARHLNVDLLIDGESWQTVVADQFRKDLLDAGLGAGDHSFSLRLPARVEDGRPHRLEARISGTEIGLDNGSLEFTQRSFFGASSPGGSALGALSVVIPTFNRGALMEKNLRACIEGAKTEPVEFIVIDDGSTDDTPERLRRLASEFPVLRWRSIPNGGPGQARNLGVTLANHELVLFLGDDIEPAGEGLYSHHLNAHQKFPGQSVAVLGKIAWPNSPDSRVSFLMTHIQGVGQQQFGFYYMMPYSWVDWRFFYTSNVSFKKSVISDWGREGFRKDFKSAAFEDSELAYRVHKEVAGGFKILYVPAAAANHHHPYTVRQFINRQITAGQSARTFAKLHPEIASEIGTAKLDKLLASPKDPGDEQADDLISMIEGIKSWGAVIEARYQLGSQNWHAELLNAIFEMCYLQGYVMACEDRSANYGRAYQHVLERFEEKMSSAATLEVFGRFPSFTLT